MRKLAHIGIPSKTKPENAIYVDSLKLYITNPDASANKLERLFFDDDCPMPKLVQDCAHLAYLVDDIQAELKDANVIVPLTEPMPGMKIAFIVEEGVPIEVVQLD